MPIRSSVTDRAWFWPALLAAAIVAGVIIEWVREPGSPAPDARRANVAAPRSTLRAPAAPATPTVPRAPESPPIAHAEIPRAQTSPGTEPPAPLTANRTLDPRRVLDDSARRWAESVRTVRPEILEQIRQGKLHEREQVQMETARIEASLRVNPGNEAVSRQLESIRNNLYYLDRSIDYLDQVQAENR